MRLESRPRLSRRLGVALVAAALPVVPLHAQQPTPPQPAPSQPTPTQADVERAARLARTGGGLRVGTWAVQDLAETADASYAETPVAEGFYAKGLDRHLVVEHSIGFWRRTQSLTQDDGLGGTTTDRVQTYIVPQFTGLTLYPLTGPAARFEPYLNAGLGIAMGIDDRQAGGTGLFGGGSGTQFVVGFGLKGGLGLDLRLTRAFGLTAGGRYQWIRFLEELGGERTYRGIAVDGGITYRFQY